MDKLNSQRSIFQESIFRSRNRLNKSLKLFNVYKSKQLSKNKSNEKNKTNKNINSCSKTINALSNSNNIKLTKNVIKLRFNRKKTINKTLQKICGLKGKNQYKTIIKKDKLTLTNKKICHNKIKENNSTISLLFNTIIPKKSKNKKKINSNITDNKSEFLDSNFNNCLLTSIDPYNNDLSNYNSLHISRNFNNSRSNKNIENSSLNINNIMYYNQNQFIQKNKGKKIYGVLLRKKLIGNNSLSKNNSNEKNRKSNTNKKNTIKIRKSKIHNKKLNNTKIYLEEILKKRLKVESSLKHKVKNINSLIMNNCQRTKSTKLNFIAENDKKIKKNISKRNVIKNNSKTYSKNQNENRIINITIDNSVNNIINNIMSFNKQNSDLFYNDFKYYKYISRNKNSKALFVNLQSECIKKSKSSKVNNCKNFMTKNNLSSNITIKGIKKTKALVCQPKSKPKKKTNTLKIQKENLKKLHEENKKQNLIISKKNNNKELMCIKEIFSNFTKRKKNDDDQYITPKMFSKFENFNLLNFSGRLNKTEEKNLEFTTKNENKNDKNNIKYDILKNPNYNYEYLDDIYRNLLIEENNYFDELGNDNFNINDKNCIKLESWKFFINSLINIQNVLKFNEHTLFLTSQIFYRYISNVLVQKTTNIIEENLDIVIVTSLIIASKKEELQLYSIKDYLNLLPDKYTSKDLVKTEYEILSGFNFNLLLPNLLDFFEIFTIKNKLNKVQQSRGLYLLNTILLDINIVQIPPSVVAYAIMNIVSKKYLNINKFNIDYKTSKGENKKIKILNVMKDQEMINCLCDFIRYIEKNIKESSYNAPVNKFNTIDYYYASSYANF